MRNRLRRELNKLGLKGAVTPHDLRDTSASLLAQELTRTHGVAAGLKAAATLGHAGVSRALRAYVDQSALIDDHSAILARTNPLETIAHDIRNHLAGIELEMKLGIGEVAPTAGHVRVVVDAGHVEAVRAELVDFGDLVEVSGDPELRYTGDDPL